MWFAFLAARGKKMGRSNRKKASRNDIQAIPAGSNQREEQTPLTTLEVGTPIPRPLQKERLSKLGTSKALPSLEKSPHTVGSTSSSGYVPPFTTQEVGSPKTPRGHWGSKLASSRPQVSMQKSGNKGGRSSSELHALPVITRGPDSLRQKQDRYRSPLHRTFGNQAVVSRVEHLCKIATWAASKVPSLGAFYGQHLASTSEYVGIPSPVLNSQCERCESILLPGVNCSVRVVPKKTKRKRRRKGKGGEAGNALNMVVYRCDYCKNGNQKPGTPARHVKTKLVQASALAQMKDLASNTSSKPCVSTGTTKPAQGQIDPSDGGDSSVALITPPASLLAPGLQMDNNSGKKRKRKGWTGLKAVATLSQNRELLVPERLRFKQGSSGSLDRKQKWST